MGNQCCASANDKNVHKETVPPENYKSQQNNIQSPPQNDYYQSSNNNLNKKKSTPSQNKLKSIPDEDRNLLDNESGGNEGRRASLGSSIVNSNSGGRMSQRTSEIHGRGRHNEQNIMELNSIPPFKMKQTIPAHDKIIVCMIELKNKMIATGSYDNTIKIWSTNHDQIILEKTIKEDGKVFSLFCSYSLCWALQWRYVIISHR